MVVAFVLNGCAKSPESISASYVSPLHYQSFDCQQIEQEYARVSRKAREVAGHQASESTKDAVAVGVGAILFWPALFFLIGDDKKEELASLKGEADALEQAAIAKQCTSLTETIEAQKRIEAEKTASKSDGGKEEDLR